MDIIPCPIEGLVHYQPKVFADERGYFLESYNAQKVPTEIAQCQWVQDNESKSTQGVLRGLHYQTGEMAQAKLVRVIVGEVYDVAVDMRPQSPTYGQWHGVYLNDKNKAQFFIPRGFAHGFVVLSDEAIFAYKCDNYYSKAHEGGLIYNDPAIAIEWPALDVDFKLSKKDLELPVWGKHIEI